MLPDRSIRNKFLTEDLSAQEFNEECRIFKKMVLKKIESHESLKHDTRKGVVNLVKDTTYMVRNHSDTVSVLPMMYYLVFTD